MTRKTSAAQRMLLSARGVVELVEAELLTAHTLLHLKQYYAYVQPYNKLTLKYRDLTKRLDHSSAVRSTASGWEYMNCITVYYESLATLPRQ